jgi:hypothetical protein
MPLDSKELFRAVNPIFVKFFVSEELPITRGYDPQKQIFEEHNNY